MTLIEPTLTTPSRATPEEADRLTEARDALTAAGDNWLLAGAARVEVTRLAAPTECVCGTPLYRHPTVFGAYYRAACHQVLEGDPR